MENEKELIENIRQAKNELDTRFNAFIDGAITISECQQWVLLLAVYMNNFMVEVQISEYNKD